MIFMESHQPFQILSNQQNLKQNLEYPNKLFVEWIMPADSIFPLDFLNWWLDFELMDDILDFLYWEILTEMLQQGSPI